MIIQMWVSMYARARAYVIVRLCLYVCITTICIYAINILINVYLGIYSREIAGVVFNSSN